MHIITYTVFFLKKINFFDFKKIYSGADPNAVNVQQTIPLHYIIRGAYSEELIEVVNLMIERGVNLEFKNKYGETPLDTAGLLKKKTILINHFRKKYNLAMKGNTESVRFLIDHLADVNTKNKLF